MEKKTMKWHWFFTLLIATLTFLTGCVNYDVGINMEGQHRGTIVQRLQLSEQFTNFSQDEAKQWLESIENRAKKLQGKVKKLAAQEIEVTIPFSNGKELSQKFNQFFNPTPSETNPVTNNQDLEWLTLNSQLKISQSNLIVVERNKIDLTVDLTALGVLSEEGNLIISSGSLVNLGLALNTPWGAKYLNEQDNLNPILNGETKTLSWQLQPGQVNHIEAVFWLPSYLGIGTIAIIIFVYLGYLLRYKLGWGSK